MRPLIEDQTPESELNKDPSIEEMKYLIEHFRNLCNSKDEVINHYRYLLEKHIPTHEGVCRLERRIIDQNLNIYQLERELNKLKIEKKKKG